MTHPQPRVPMHRRVDGRPAEPLHEEDSEALSRALAHMPVLVELVEARERGLVGVRAIVDSDYFPAFGHSSIRFATSAVHPVWCDAPIPAPLSPWKYS